jgi:hypothetical protein
MRDEELEPDEEERERRHGCIPMITKYFSCLSCFYLI